MASGGRSRARRRTRLEALVRGMLRKADIAKTASARGRCLEQLIARLFAEVEGVRFVRTNIRTAFAAEEIDVAFTNQASPHGLAFLREFVLLVECKNTGRPVSARDVSWFIDKLRSRSLRDGIMVAAHGVSGAAQKRAAEHILARALADDMRVLVVTRDDLESVTTVASLVRVLQQRYVELVLRAA